MVHVVKKFSLDAMYRCRNIRKSLGLLVSTSDRLWQPKPPSPPGFLSAGRRGEEQPRLPLTPGGPSRPACHPLPPAHEASKGVFRVTTVPAQEGPARAARNAVLWVVHEVASRCPLGLRPEQASSEMQSPNTFTKAGSFTASAD